MLRPLIFEGFTVFIFDSLKAVILFQMMQEITIDPSECVLLANVLF